MPKPPLPKAKFRHYPLTIKFNRAELNLLRKQMAQENHTTIQSYIRQAIYRDVVKDRLTPNAEKCFFKIEDLIF